MTGEATEEELAGVRPCPECGRAVRPEDNYLGMRGLTFYRCDCGWADTDARAIA